MAPFSRGPATPLATPFCACTRGGVVANGQPARARDARGAAAPPASAQLTSLEGPLDSKASSDPKAAAPPQWRLGTVTPRHSGEAHPCGRPLIGQLFLAPSQPTRGCLGTSIWGRNAADTPGLAALPPSHACVCPLPHSERVVGGRSPRASSQSRAAALAAGPVGARGPTGARRHASRSAPAWGPTRGGPIARVRPVAADVRGALSPRRTPPPRTAAPPCSSPTPPHLVPNTPFFPAGARTSSRCAGHPPRASHHADPFLPRTPTRLPPPPLLFAVVFGRQRSGTTCGRGRHGLVCAVLVHLTGHPLCHPVGRTGRPGAGRGRSLGRPGRHGQLGGRRRVAPAAITAG